MLQAYINAQIQAYYLSILIVVLFLSCADKTKSNKENSNNRATTKEPVPAKPLSLDTGVVSLPHIKPKEKFISVFPLGTFKSYPQIVKGLFGIGSNQDEVRNVMGRPDLDKDEVWYYGTVEIHFKYGLVDNVVNPQSCKKYVSMADLLISQDPIEKKFGQFLLDRASTLSKFK